jgi:transcription-repair coupling factor (superfamily II helicase)
MNELKRVFELAMRADALRQLGARLRQGFHSLTLAGTAGGTKALTIASAILAENRSVAVFTTTSEDAQNLAQEISFYLQLFSPRPPEVIHLPGLDVDPYRGLSPHHEVASARAHALWQVLQGGPAILVTSMRAAAVRLHSPQRLLANCLELKPGDEYPPDKARSHLHEAGYVEDDPVTDPGEFSLRGGILDVFPPHMENPARLEFFGDQVDSIRTFDLDSQRSITSIPRVEIIPMREYCFVREKLERWAAEAPSLWSEPFLKHLTEELALARQGEPFGAFEFMLPSIDPRENTIFDYIPGFRIIACERAIQETALEKYNSELYDRYVDRIEAQKPIVAPEQIFLTAEQYRAHLDRSARIEIEQLGVEQSAGSPVLYLAAQPTRKYHGNIRELMADVRKSVDAGEQLVFVSPNLGRAERLKDILSEYEFAAHLCRAEEIPAGDTDTPRAPIVLGVAHLHDGYFLPGQNLRVLTGKDVFDEAEIGRRARSAQRNLFLSDFRDLKPGDYVVHLDHGIGQFHGLKSIGMQDGMKEFVLLSYYDDAKLYVPVERLDLIQKYSNVGGAKPTLDRLGSTSWTKTKSRIKKSMRDMAEELLKLYAERQTVEGFAFSADSAWQMEFEDAFEYDLTIDQADAVASVKKDMETARPMDRLLCGDVGYGKTEVAMRAAFKAVMDGKQAAILTPTTVLAFQHYTTFTRRFTTFPVQTQLLSRFRSPKEQKQILEDLAAGGVDIVIGTHRLLSKDVQFKDLGLVIVDEEQRFGVGHKERLKALKTRVDVLTLTATPIPRTLNMALLGLRDMSTIETPPKNRLAIQTSVVRYSPDVVRSAIELELARNGQIYFVHNRVETIHSVAAMVQQLVPRARIGVAHGQMGERDLERVMLRFVQDELDVLVATTIIENGLDIPRVNTIIVDRADLYGLAQLYQLRGRVGRSDRRAYAYLLVPSDDGLSEVARKRLAAIREFSDLGTGFRVAALDLEIRGAGNLLGGEQHGHIDAIGFDLYCQLLEQTVEELRGQKPAEEISTTINLNLDIRIPDAYIPDSSQRLRMYKRVSSAQQEQELESLRQELVDRYGKFGEPVENLFRYARLRQTALSLRVQAIERKGEQVYIRLAEHSDVSPQKLLKLLTRNRRAQFSPQGLLSLEAPGCPPEKLFQLLHRTLDEIRA